MSTLFHTPALWLPSYDQGFARDASEAWNRNLWDGLVFNWHGPLGVTGIGTDSIKDTSGYSNDSTPSGMVASDWVMTEKSWALDFNGSSKYIVVPPQQQLNTEHVTVSAIVRSEGSGSDEVVNRETGVVVLRATSTTWFFQVKVGGVAYQAESGSAPTGDWQHVVGTYDGLIVRLYVDGALVAATAKTGVIDTGSFSKFYIGAHTNPTNYFDGQIASVDIWGRAIAFSEIQQLVDEHAIVRPRLAVPLSSGAAPAAGIEAFKYYYDQQEAVACG